jgi:hypothetical protein
MRQKANPKSISFIVLFLATLLTGCEGPVSLSPGSSEHVLAFPSISRQDNSIQNPYPPPDNGISEYYGAPPAAVLFVGEQQQTAALGSYCWIQGMEEGSPVEGCQDSAGIPTPQVFLPGAVQFEGRLRLPLPFPPATLSVYTMPVTPADTVQPPSEGKIIWSYLEGTTIALAPETEQELQLELMPGLNVLYINAQWEGLGTVGYGFIVDAIVP